MGKSIITLESKIVDVRGRPVHRGGLTFEELQERTAQAHPDWPRAAVLWQAEKLFERWPKLERAIDAGLVDSIGRDLRQRWEAGLGIELIDTDPPPDGATQEQIEFSAAMLDIEPVERQVVLDVLRARIGAAS